MLVEKAPEACSNGHPFGPQQVLVGWHPCECRGQRFGELGGGHRTYACQRCDDVIYRPPHNRAYANDDSLGATPQGYRDGPGSSERP